MIDGAPAVESAAPPHAERAIDAIAASYLNTVGVDVRDGLRVHWATVLPADHLGMTWHAASYGCSSWIIADAMFAYPRVLSHELGHCARWLATGDGDAGHRDAAWWADGGLADQAFAAQKRAGL